jgi:hypothetical protein
MFKFYFLDDDIEHNISFHSNALYYNNMSIFLFTFCYTNFSNRSIVEAIN